MIKEKNKEPQPLFPLRSNIDVLRAQQQIFNVFQHYFSAFDNLILSYMRCSVFEVSPIKKEKNLNYSKVNIVVFQITVTYLIVLNDYTSQPYISHTMLLKQRIW